MGAGEDARGEGQSETGGAGGACARLRLDPSADLSWRDGLGAVRHTTGRKAEIQVGMDEGKREHEWS